MAISLGIGIGLPCGRQAASAPVSDITQAEILGPTSLAADGGAPPIGINGDGWVLRVRTLAKAGGITPDISKFLVTANDPGFDWNGSAFVATSRTRAMVPLGLLRRPANGTTMPTSTTDPQALAIQGGSVVAPGSLTPGVAVDWYIPLPSRVFSTTTSVVVWVDAAWYGDAAPGFGPTVTNSSTRTVGDPIFGFMNTPCDRVEASSLLVELHCNRHRFARNGRAVCGVELWATDGTNNGPISRVAATTLSTIQTREAIAEVFAATLDLTGVNNTDGTTTLGVGRAYVDGWIYPWIGPAYRISVSGASWPTAQPCTVLPFVKDTAGQYGGAICYIAPSAGASPAVSRTPAVDKAAAYVQAYGTIAAAATAVAAFNNNSAGRPAGAILHNNCGGSRFIFLDNAGADQAYELGANVTTTGSTCWSDFEPHPSNTGVAYYNATVQRRWDAGLLRFKGLEFRKTAGSISCNDTAAGSNNIGCALDGVTTECGGTGNIFQNMGITYQRNVLHKKGTFSNANVLGLSTHGSSGQRCSKAIGISYAPGDTSITLAVNVIPYMVVGISGKINLQDPSTGQQTTNDGFIVDNFKFYAIGATMSFVNDWAISRGFYVGQGFLEFIAGQDFGIAANSTASTTILNGAIEHVTLPQDKTGVAADVGRLNHAYNDTAGSRGRITEIDVWHCYGARQATKTDTFAFFNSGSVTGAVLNFPVAYNVDCGGNRLGISRPPSFTASDFWRKVIDAQSAQNVGAVGFNDNQAGIGSTGFGFNGYVPQDTRLADAVLSSMARRSFDLAGIARRNNGTGYAGAYERP